MKSVQNISNNLFLDDVIVYSTTTKKYLSDPLTSTPFGKFGDLTFQPTQSEAFELQRSGQKLQAKRGCLFRFVAPSATKETLNVQPDVLGCGIFSTLLPNVFQTVSLVFDSERIKDEASSKCLTVGDGSVAELATSGCTDPNGLFELQGIMNGKLFIITFGLIHA